MALGNTLLVSFGATLIATVAGTCLAWVVVRTNTPFARLLERLATLPIFIPPLVGGVAWILLSAPRIGLFNVVLRHLGFGEHFDIYQRAGIVWVMGIYLAPYVMMVVASALRNMDPNLEDAAHVSGLGDFRTLQIITLPVMAPAILSGAALVFVMVIGIFGTPMLLGWPRQILLLTSRIYLEWNQHPRALGVIAVLTVYLIILSSAANSAYGLAAWRSVVCDGIWKGLPASDHKARPCAIHPVCERFFLSSAHNLCASRGDLGRFPLDLHLVRNIYHR